jgi:hypothetical protein
MKIHGCVVLSTVLACGTQERQKPLPVEEVPPISSWPSMIAAEEAAFAVVGANNDLFLVFDARVDRIDLPTGDVIMSTAVPSPARRLAIADDRLFVLGGEAGAESEITVLDAGTGAALASFSVPFAEELQMLSNEKIFLATASTGHLVRDDGRIDAEIQLSSGLIYGSFGMHEVDGKVHVPRAYPGGIDVIRVEDGALLETIPTHDWIHDVRKIDDRFVVTGHIDGVSIVRPGGGDDIVVDVGVSFASHVLPYLESWALVLANDAVHRIDIDGTKLGAWPLPDALRRDEEADVTWRFDDWILRTHEGRALVFVRSKGAGWIELAD